MQKEDDHIPTLCGIPFKGARWREEWLQPGLSIVYTVNAEFLYWSLKMPRFREALERGDCTADGKWVVWLLNLKYGGKIAEHLPGSRLALKILEEAGRLGLKVGFVGETEEILARAAQEAKRRWNVEVATYAPGIIPLEPREDDEEVESIRRFVEEARPDILFIALGPPKQEILIDVLKHTLDNIGARLAMGVGGTLKMLAGVEKPAPHLISRVGLEWLWRFIQNPRKRAVKVWRSVRGLMCGLREAVSSRVRGGSRLR
ncbi:MAG: WecB/TagA/CpsF family glycosyltransferase [Desulfurococcales archaeon]|nr:WecB/TagA/CpsF family glycosyltransferase [Desulfurococcales archaeon]